MKFIDGIVLRLMIPLRMYWLGSENNGEVPTLSTSMNGMEKPIPFSNRDWKRSKLLLGQTRNLIGNLGHYFDCKWPICCFGLPLRDTQA